MIRLSKSCLSQKEVERVNKTLSLEFLGMGEEVRVFESLLAEYLESDVTCVSSGTSALHLALQAVGVGPGDEVLVQSITYVATFQAITATGAVPISCDVRPESMTICLDSARKRLSKRTKAIIAVHYSGDPQGFLDVLEFGKEFGLRVIEDAAHAFGSRLGKQLVGSFGDITCFSFDGIKNITSGEGGCVVTKDQQVTKSVSDSRLLAIQNDTEARFSGQRSWEFDVLEQGWRYHMSNVMASIGIAQFQRREDLFHRRQVLAQMYDNLLSEFKVITRFERDYSRIVPHIYVVILPAEVDRGKIRAMLLREGIQTGVHYQPCHELSYFRKMAPVASLPVTKNVSQRLLSLPLHPDLNDDEVSHVVMQLTKAISEL